MYINLFIRIVMWVLVIALVINSFVLIKILKHQISNTWLLIIEAWHFFLVTWGLSMLLTN